MKQKNAATGDKAFQLNKVISCGFCPYSQVMNPSRAFPFSLSFRPSVLSSGVKLRIKNNAEFTGMESIIKIDGNDKGTLENDMFLEISLIDKTIDFILLKTIQESQDTLWIQKLSKSLGWNYAFNH